MADEKGARIWRSVFLFSSPSGSILSDDLLMRPVARPGCCSTSSPVPLSGFGYRPPSCRQPRLNLKKVRPQISEKNPQVNNKSSSFAKNIDFLISHFTKPQFRENDSKGAIVGRRRVFQVAGSIRVFFFVGRRQSISGRHVASRGQDASSGVAEFHPALAVHVAAKALQAAGQAPSGLNEKKKRDGTVMTRY